MKKILIVTTHTDIVARLNKMFQNRSLPDAEYSVVVEAFQEVLPNVDGIKNVFVIDDLRNRTAIDDAVQQCREWGPYDHILPTDEYAVYLAAEIRERLGMSGLRRSDVLKFRDKVVMKRAVAPYVRVPKLYSPEDLLEDEGLLPVVVKPRSYAGSKGIRVIRAKNELEEVLKTYRKRDDQSDHSFEEFSMEDMEFEELIEGPIFHIDGLVLSGEIIYCNASRYIGTCLDFLNGSRLGSVSVSDLGEQEAWRVFAREVCSGMDVPDGAFHLEAFHSTDGDRVFLEIGIRPGGALIVPSIEQATGMNLDVAHLQCQLGIRPNLDGQGMNCFGWLVYPKQFNDDSRKIITRVKVPDLSRLLSVQWHAIPKEGDCYTGSFSYVHNLGSFIFVFGQSDQIGNDIATLSDEYEVVA